MRGDGSLKPTKGDMGVLVVGDAVVGELGIWMGMVLRGPEAAVM